MMSEKEIGKLEVSDKAEEEHGTQFYHQKQPPPTYNIGKRLFVVLLVKHFSAD